MTSDIPRKTSRRETGCEYEHEDKAFKRPVTLETIKTDKVLATMPLVKQSRLSVTPLTREQAERLLKLAMV
jgi:predicted RNA-binding protein with PUA-like domain